MLLRIQSHVARAMPHEPLVYALHEKMSCPKHGVRGLCCTSTRLCGDTPPCSRCCVYAVRSIVVQELTLSSIYLLHELVQPRLAIFLHLQDAPSTFNSAT